LQPAILLQVLRNFPVDDTARLFWDSRRAILSVTMAPKKTIPSPPSIYTPSTPIDPEHEAKLKAEARAYALSGGSSCSSGTKRKSPPSASSTIRKVSKTTSASTTTAAMTASMTTGTGKPTSLSIHRPEKQHKPNPKLPSTMASAATPVNLSAQVFDDDDDDYERFVKSLGLDDSFFASLDHDDEEFHLSDVEEEDDEEDDAEAETQEDKDTTPTEHKNNKTVESTPPLSSPLSSSPMVLPDFERDMYRDLEEELGSLLEEDMEAAVQSLMTSKKPTTPTSTKTSSSTTSSPQTPKASAKKQPKTGAENNNESPATPLREAARQGTRAQVTYQQSQQLRRLMTRHHQLLVQQGISAVRAAQMQKLHKEKSDFLSGETADDLAEILDGAVGMLQDLDQNRKDAIRNSIQLPETSNGGGSTTTQMTGRRSLFSKFAESSDTQPQHIKDRRLTRAAFSKTLEQQGGNGSKRTAFDIPGLMKLKETFATIDKSVDGVKGSNNILEVPTHAEACNMVLRQAGAHIDDGYIPGNKDLSENFCDAKEVFGEEFETPCTEDQQIVLRRNRNLFSSGEDNLVLRGVNLYGEKQWILIADRYLPDRSVNIISQRYSKLCVMLYKAHDIHIDSKGNLLEPPKLESVDDIDNSKVTELGLKAVDPPAILNVHRWSLEEDLTLLKAVPIMGHMWAELGARLIPHRDRGHLRKRYQVLERRVKATVVRSAKGETSTLKVARWQGNPRKTNTPAVPAKPTLVKAGNKATIARALPRKVPARKPVVPAPTMSIEKAAASLAFLRPPRSGPPPAAPAATAPVLAKHSGKVIPELKLIPSTRKSISSKRPPPRLPVAKSTIPLKAYGGESQLHGDPACSRAAFEKLVDGTAEDWSQMSRMKKMLENDAESQAADAIVSHLAKSPVSSGLSKLPQMELDTNSMSGLSILQSEASRQATAVADDKKASSNSGVSIMSRVLEGASKSSDSEKKPSDKKKEPTNPSNSMESPRKRPPKSMFNPATPGPPTTPKRQNFFSMSGTPIGLSPGFLRNGGGIALTPNAPYSPARSTMMRLMNDQSVDELQFCDFQISEESRKELEGEPKEPQHDPTPPPLTPSKNSLMFGEHDLEAISALNSLSNSPFRQKKRPEEDKGSKKEKKKSLFAAVVGGIKQKDPKKKLQF
jgi:hypothetical protein